VSRSTITKMLSYLICVNGSFDGGSLVIKFQDIDPHGRSSVGNGCSSPYRFYLVFFTLLHVSRFLTYSLTLVVSPGWS